MPKKITRRLAGINKNVKAVRQRKHPTLTIATKQADLLAFGFGRKRRRVSNGSGSPDDPILVENEWEERGGLWGGERGGDVEMIVPETQFAQSTQSLAFSSDEEGEQWGRRKLVPRFGKRDTKSAGDGKLTPRFPTASDVTRSRSPQSSPPPKKLVPRFLPAATTRAPSPPPRKLASPASPTLVPPFKKLLPRFSVPPGAIVPQVLAVPLPVASASTTSVREAGGNISPSISSRELMPPPPVTPKRPRPSLRDEIPSSQSPLLSPLKTQQAHTPTKMGLAPPPSAWDWLSTVKSSQWWENEDTQDNFSETETESGDEVDAAADELPQHLQAPKSTDRSLSVGDLSFLPLSSLDSTWSRQVEVDRAQKVDVVLDHGGSLSPEQPQVPNGSGRDPAQHTQSPGGCVNSSLFCPTPREPQSRRLSVGIPEGDIDPISNREEQKSPLHRSTRSLFQQVRTPEKLPAIGSLDRGSPLGTTTYRSSTFQGMSPSSLTPFNCGLRQSQSQQSSFEAMPTQKQPMLDPDSQRASLEDTEVSIPDTPSGEIEPDPFGDGSQPPEYDNGSQLQPEAGDNEDYDGATQDPSIEFRPVCTQQFPHSMFVRAVTPPSTYSSTSSDEGSPTFVRNLVLDYHDIDERSGGEEMELPPATELNNGEESFSEGLMWTTSQLLPDTLMEAFPMPPPLTQPCSFYDPDETQ